MIHHLFQFTNWKQKQINSETRWRDSQKSFLAWFITASESQWPIWSITSNVSLEVIRQQITSDWRSELQWVHRRSGEPTYRVFEWLSSLAEVKYLSTKRYSMQSTMKSQLMKILRGPITWASFLTASNRLFIVNININTKHGETRLSDISFL